jgi:hypothetical protein
LLEIIVEIMDTTKSEKGNEGAEGRKKGRFTIPYAHVK